MNFSNNRFASRYEETEKIKIIFQYILMLVASLACGIFFANIQDVKFIDSAFSKISLHFNSFSSFDMWTYFSGIWKLCQYDIICIIFLLVFSFSFLNCIVTDLVLVFYGFRYGMNTAVLSIISLTKIGIGNALMFLILRGVILIVMFLYSFKMSEYSLNIRKFSDNGRMVINMKLFASLLLSAVMALGATIFVNAIYCLILYF